MNPIKALAVLITIASVSATQANMHPLSDQHISLINEKQSTWIAGKNFDISEWERVKIISSGVLPNRFPKVAANVNPHDEGEYIPESFDSREKWSECDSLRQIRDQSSCGSCWAFAAVEAMSDRICIHSNQTKQVYVSAEDLNSCCFDCGGGCSGGFIDEPWYYWHSNGIVTGGLYNSSQGCKDYSLEPCEHYVDQGSRPQCSNFEFDTPDCKTKCDNLYLSYKDSLTYGEEAGEFTNERQIQLEIFKNGPVEADFIVYDDFPNYKSGVYQPTSQSAIGGHAVKIIGWGVENEVKYWLVANSWNSDWGDKGYFKFIRGINSCGMESEVYASLPL